jgi:hypothetical protein
MNIERACCTCQWWDRKSFKKAERNTGWCRILPPRNNGGDESYWGWPLTYDEDWCSRYQPREEAK